MCQLQSGCNLCHTGSYVGYARGHLYARVNSHRPSSSVRKHYDNDHACNVPEDPLSYFKVQLKKKCRNKFRLSCKRNEMLYINKSTFERANGFNPCQSLCPALLHLSNFRILELFFNLAFIYFQFLDNCVMRSPKRQNITLSRWFVHA